MANYAIDPSVLHPYLPGGTELDTFNGTHYVSLVGFLFAGVKVVGLSAPFHRTFEEVNLRFYVRYNEGGQWKRGVVFVKEIVPRRLISFIANTIYGEAYSTHAMKHSFGITNNEMAISYQWKVGAEWNYMNATTDIKPEAIPEGSEEEFITEHYWGYTFINKGCSGAYQVSHPRWKVHTVTHYAIHCDAETLYGAAFAEALQQKPRSVFVAEGSPVAVMKGSKIYL